MHVNFAEYIAQYIISICFLFWPDLVSFESIQLCLH